MTSSTKKKNHRSIYVYLYGGLGNQLFQLGSALAVSGFKKSDKAFLNNYLADKHKVKRLPILHRLIDLNKANFNFFNSASFLGTSRLARFVPFTMHNRTFVNDNNIKKLIDNNFLYQEYYVDGYFQEYLDNKYFGLVKDSIIKLISPDFKRSLIPDNKKLVIHIRGGDFLEFSHGDVCDKNYYTNAIEYMNSKKTFSQVLIVTDDVEYAKFFIKSCKIKKAKIISNSDPLEDFKIIASFNHRIISNSTFAMWASVLGNNYDDGLVICPRDFYKGSKRSFDLVNEVNELQ